MKIACHSQLREMTTILKRMVVVLPEIWIVQQHSSSRLLPLQGETKDEGTFKVGKGFWQKHKRNVVLNFSSLFRVIMWGVGYIRKLGFTFTEKVIKIVTEHNLWKETSTFKNIKCFLHFHCYTIKEANLVNDWFTWQYWDIGTISNYLR